MGPQLCILLLGLLLLPGWGTAQKFGSTENSTEEEHWPRLVISRNLPFLCDPKMLRSNVSSSSVDTLRPSDIKFVASIGIKETFPAWSPAGVMEQLQRAEKMSQEVCMEVGTVLLGIIRSFNPTLLSPVCTPKRKVVPQSGPEHLWTQTTDLVRIMRENPQLDFENDWKLINVFISNVNECYLCPLTGQQSILTRTMNKLAETLDFLYEEVPRAFVNLVDLTEILEFSALSEAGTQGRDNTESCRCSEETVLSRAVARWSYQETWERMLISSRYNWKESFALVLQPFFYETEQFFFLKEHPLQDPTALGLHLWNIMVGSSSESVGAPCELDTREWFSYPAVMEPTGHKDTPYSMRERRPVKCPPQEHPYLFTYRNSNYQSWSSITPRDTKQEDVQFMCTYNPPSTTNPLSVHRLKPADIKVVAAVGDAFTAANGAGSRPLDFRDVMTEYRGLSWSIGGDRSLRTIITLPNILRQFNSHLKGYSIGTGKEITDGAWLNQAVSKAFSGDLSNQIRNLIRLMKTDQKIDYNEDWKLLTMFIGSNDLCDFCNDQVSHSPVTFRRNIQHALDILHAEVPRMFVNMVLPMELIGLRELSQDKRLSCNVPFLRRICPCLMLFSDGDPQLARLAEVNKEYQEQVEQLVESGRYDTRDDFTVVLQPFFERLEVPRTEEGLLDLTYFAPDCFHFSQKTHGHIASALWNNMLEPVDQKTRQHHFTSKIRFSCPTEDQPFLITRKNNIRKMSVVEKYGSTLNCPDTSPSATVPKSVHSLKPADIKVVAALGDFMTAGNGIGSEPDNFLGFTIEYRGLSFSGGGDGTLDNVTTLPNILRKFNSNLTGYGTCTGDAKSVSAFLNQAVPRAKAKDLINQVTALVERMKNTSNINFSQDWKVITVMIGNHDICDFCKDQTMYSAEKFLDHIHTALDYLQEEVPRALVNLVDFMDLEFLRLSFQRTQKCFKPRTSYACDCVLTPKKGSSEIALLDSMTKTYQNALRNVLGKSRYDRKEDFTVVLQPFMTNIRMPYLQDGSLDTSFFIPDCFHPSQKFHSQLARALWNNMLQPLGSKERLLDLGVDINIMCPQTAPKVPFFRTTKNSDYKYPDWIGDQDWGGDLHCDVMHSSGIPFSAHRLRPSDIKVVAALGDWITTGLGANRDNGNRITNWRGLSWSIGGDQSLEKHATLPNILRVFNPWIRGFSHGTWMELSALNVAEVEARARDLPAQARDLLNKLETAPEINVETDWKLVTIFIGFNDLCDFCTHQNKSITEDFHEHVTETIDIFFEKLPRVYINLVEIMQVATLYQNQGGRCAQPLLPHTDCLCFRDSENSSVTQGLKEVNEKFQTMIFNITSMEQYKKREDFAVIAQPFFRESTFPQDSDGNIDSRYFADDCFHFSSLTQNEMAIALWNNMLEPMDNKSTSYDFIFDRNKVSCPSSKNPYFATEKNALVVRKKWWRFWILISLMLFFFPVFITTLIVVANRERILGAPRT